VAQEAFVRAWRHGASYDPCRGSVATWLLRITRNLAVDSLRLRRPGDVEPDLLEKIGWASEPAAIEEAAITSDRAAAVRAALRRLPPEQARAVLLAAYYDRTAAEISRLEGIPLGTAKTRIRLGLRRVRALLLAEVEEVP
jgi:RNA polymerase sigma-70 factor (ECF subfamily)